MKLATYKDGRDLPAGRGVPDLTVAHWRFGVSKLQSVLEDWNFTSPPQLQDISDAEPNWRARHAFPFEPACCMALPCLSVGVDWLHAERRVFATTAPVMVYSPGRMTPSWCPTPRLPGVWTLTPAVNRRSCPRATLEQALSGRAAG
jgi:hypothetical protein